MLPFDWKKPHRHGHNNPAPELSKAEAKHVFHCSGDENPYVVGMFVIDSLEESSPAQDDATYSGQLSNAGEPETYPGKPAAA